MKTRFITLLLMTVALSFTSCEYLDGLDDKKDKDPEVSITYPINGEYYVTLDMFDTESSTWVVDVYGIGYNKIMFSNTAANDKDIVWFDDLELWPTRAKIKCDPANSKFLAGEFKSVQKSGEFDIVDEAEDIEAFKAMYPIELTETPVNDTMVLLTGFMKVTVSDGFILKAATVTASKFHADSINIQIEWSDDPGTKYRYAGYRRTGYLEDEH